MSPMPHDNGMRWVDTSNARWWTCVVPAVYTVEDFAAEFDRATELFHRLPYGQRFVYTADFTNVASSDPRNRARVVRFLRECHEPIKNHMIAWGIVTPRPLLRGAITAITWLGQFPVPTRVFAERRECDVWLSQQLEAESVASR